MNSFLLTPPGPALTRHFSFGLEEVMILEGVRNYTRFIKTSGQHILTCRPLGRYMSQLPRHFVRVHKSYAVNCRFISFVDNANHSIVMQNGTTIPISRRKWMATLQILINSGF